MKFLVDAQLPPELVGWLKDKGQEAQHVEQCGLRDAEDAAIWAYALAAECVLVTKDQDFAERVTREQGGPRIVWLRVGNTTNPALAHWMEKRLSDIVALLERGDRLIEVR